MACLLMFLVSLGIQLSSPTAPEPQLHESVSFLTEKLENLAIQQDLIVKQLDAVVRQSEEDKQHTAEMKAEWAKAQQQWGMERQALVALLLENLQKTNECSDSDTPKALVRDVETRSDDVNALEPVVTQMTQRLTELTAEVQTLKNSHNVDMQALRDAAKEAGSSVYIRWGNSGCPLPNSLVYSGVVGGSHFSSPGGATNHLCLSLSPVLSNHRIPTAYANLYGGEYFTGDGNDGKDPLCAVCRAPRPTVIMVPGTNRCEVGWTTEYSGYIMAGVDHDTGGSEFICVDDHFEGRLGSDERLYGTDLFFTVTHCGSLPCGPYVNNKIVTCAVCSK